MAAAHSPATSIPLHFTITATHFSRKPFPKIYCISIPTPKRPSNRKNYLRHKLLRTLIKPYPNTIIPQPPPTNSEITPLLPTEEDLNFPSSDQFPAEPSPSVTGEEVKVLENEEFEQSELKNEDFKQSEASQSVEVISGNVGNFPKSSVLKFGLWLVGAFVFQTVCAVWVFGSADFDKDNVNLETKNEKINGNNVLEMGFDGNDESRLKLHVNGNDDDMFKKIEEIKVMAREVREKESMERKTNSVDGNESDFEDEEDGSFAKSEIEKEVFERLDKLRKRLEKNVEKFPVGYLKGDDVRKDKADKNVLDAKFPMGYLKEDLERKDGVEKNGINEKEGNEALVFKKKYKFKKSLGEDRDRPKGFSGVSDRGDGKIRGRSSDSGNEVLRSRSNVDGGINMLDEKQGLEANLREGIVRESVEMDINEGGRRKVKEKKPVEGKSRRKQGKRVDVAESKFPKVQDRNLGRPLVETGDSRETSIGVTDKSNASLKKQDRETDWWSSLPYILVILLQRDGKGEGQRGLYTLKGNTYTEGESSYIVAFADRGDATNFCYLLQSFFEDLGDFSSEILPLSIKELKEAMKSLTKNVIVLKKGQLQLYVGQPLADVEMALRSLVEQSY